MKSKLVKYIFPEKRTFTYSSGDVYLKMANGEAMIDIDDAELLVAVEKLGGKPATEKKSKKAQVDK